MASRNKMRLYRILLIVLTVPLLKACYYDVEEELYPEGEIPIGVNISYSANVDPILNINCYACHYPGNSAGGGFVFQGYDNLKKYLDANSSTFICCIKHTGCSDMPLGASKLSNRDIGYIERWINEGALNN